ncbi:hypothetical protein Cni_G20893 [Canna indica]|uniref:Plastocyanin-like domain-containing protein n=1 Tax=Canna indica TaxID=4628 RepID=A0AAQ3KS35_9LILI|nr:hypothetical protein Cni_G20893 [Canna indica]
MEGSSYCPLEHAIMELGRLVSNSVEGDESGSGRIWVVGIATYQTYMSCISLGNLHELSLNFNRGTNIIVGEEHPMHLHGYHFYMLATGKGNFEPARDAARFQCPLVLWRGRRKAH